MGTETAIQWTDHTFNPWIGCTKVSEGCRNCYAAAQDHRWGHERWGPGAPREVTSVSNWRKPILWNAAAAAAGKRARVFCASLADVFDVEAPEGALAWLWALIEATPWLDWQLLTKRPERVPALLPWGSGAPWPNVWIGTSAEDQGTWDNRVQHLGRINAAVRFVSAEPLLGPIDCGNAFDEPPAGSSYKPVDWVIVGGESGGGARPMSIEWARAIVHQVPRERAVFVKQLGSKPYEERGPLDVSQAKRPLRLPLPPAPPFVPLRLSHYKGGDPEEWPAELRVREFPR
jgi:protein gp37